MSLGLYLKSIREQNGLTIKQVVALSEGMLDKTTISRIERDERGLSIKAAYALAKIYHADISEICELSLGLKINITHVPFDTSSDERRLILNYRHLSRARQKAVQEITKGLCLARHPENSAEARRRLMEALEQSESED